MIKLTRLNGKDFVLNCELIKSIEATPDTLLTLVSGEKFMVRESIETIVDETIKYRQKIYKDGPVTQIQKSGSSSRGQEKEL